MKRIKSTTNANFKVINFDDKISIRKDAMTIDNFR